MYSQHRPLGLLILGGLQILSGIHIIFTTLGGNVASIGPINLPKNDVFSIIVGLFFIWIGFSFLALKKYAWYISLVFYSFFIIGLLGIILINYSEFSDLEQYQKIVYFVIFIINFSILMYVYSLKEYFSK